MHAGLSIRNNFMSASNPVTQFPSGKYFILTTGSNRGEVRFQIPMETGVIKSPTGALTKRVTLVAGIFKNGHVDASRYTGFGDLVAPVVDEISDCQGWREVKWKDMYPDVCDKIARRAINLVTVYAEPLTKAERAEIYRKRAMSATI